MSLTTQHVRIAGKVYDLTVEDKDMHYTARVKQFPGIVSSAPDEGKAIDNVIRAIVDKVSESQGKT